MPDTAQTQATDSQINSAKQEIFDYVKTRLGDGMIEVELDPKHLDNAFVTAVDKFRQRSSNAVEESYAFLELKKNLHATYTYTYAWQPKRLLAHSSFICRSCFAVSIRLICQGKGVGCHIALVSTLGFLLPYKLQDLFLPA